MSVNDSLEQWQSIEKRALLASSRVLIIIVVSIVRKPMTVTSLCHRGEGLNT